MTYFATALTNDNARLIVSKTQTTDEAIFNLVVENLKARGFIVVTRSEG